MRFNTHLELLGEHAILSASKYHWIRYDDEKLVETFMLARAAAKGSELHDFARRCIELRQTLPRTRKTLNMYVNDAIGFGMTPEQVLYYSPNAFGTPDAISFKKNFLRIHDYKSGVHPGHFDQLKVYTALFCLEYKFRPSQIDYELRIYQHDDFRVLVPEKDEIVHIIDKLIMFNKRIEQLKREAYGD